MIGDCAASDKNWWCFTHQRLAWDCIAELRKEICLFRRENRLLKDENVELQDDRDHLRKEIRGLNDKCRQLREAANVRTYRDFVVRWKASVKDKAEPVYASLCQRCKRPHSSTGLHQPFGVNTPILLLCDQCSDIITNATPGEEQGP